MVPAVVSIVFVTLAFCHGPVQARGLDMAHPKWVTTNWAAKDPFEGAWKPYAAALAKSRGYVENSGWPEKARAAIGALGKKPTAEALYKAAASYLVAVDLDWRFEIDPDRRNVTQRPSSTPLWCRLFRAWSETDENPRSKEFSRLGFAVCSPSWGPALDAGDMPQALLKAFPRDRVVISSVVWYSMAGTRPLTWEWRSWVVDQALLLPDLPDCRPQDYLTLATAYIGRHWVKDTLADAVACRKNLMLFLKRVPPADARRFDKTVKNVNDHIRKLGGKSSDGDR